ncbi:MAG: glycosyltransferase family 4 protein [Kiritimatiellae bacterium]|nr:glycosyltransferase family 4 protein [Kiritimatiellia bacterium]
MKILQVLPELDQGGVERGTVEIAGALAAAGIPSAVASAGGRLAAELKAMGVEHFTLPLASKNPFVIFSNARKLARIVKDGGFTLMHVRSRAPAWSVKKASRISGVPFVSTWHGLYGTDPKFLKLPYNRVMLSGRGTIAVSDCVRKHILETYGADPKCVTTIHRGADVERFHPSAVSAETVTSAKESLGIDPQVPVVSLPGRLTSLKGQHILLEAASLMKTRSFALLFVGSDQGRVEYSQRLKTMAAELKGVKTVFLDHSSQMPLIYAMSDVVVSASYSHPEAFGRVITEAQAMGRIVVASAHGGACETVSDGMTGFLVPPGDPAVLAATLDRALGLSTEERARISTAAVKSAVENFSISKMCSKTIEYYKEIHDERK